jgi:hypothetical protein
MKRTFVGMLALLSMLATVLIVGAGGGVAGAASNTPCGSGSPLVNVNYTLTNDYDSGVAGNAWANDTINRHLQVWQISPSTFCASVNDTGSFVTFAGPSPQNTGTVSAGISGRINGGYTTTEFTGTLNSSPAYSTRGNLGSFDLQCVDANTCPGAHPSFLSYVTPVTWDYANWGWTYHTAKNGDWLNASSGNSGDITG